MKIGKLTNEELKEIIISGIDINNSDIIAGPGVGEDCAAVRCGRDEVMALTTDPVTAASENAGAIGVHICCNDIASSGIKPLGLLVTLLLPPSTEKSQLSEVMKQINDTARELEVNILGGHTEVTDAVNRIVISITAIGKGKESGFIRTGGAIEGDELVLTGYAGLEGTGIIAADCKNKLIGKVSSEVIDSAKKLIGSISVVKAGLLAASFGVNAMHDVTEGGVYGAAWEVAESSLKGLMLYRESIPMLNETKLICSAADIDPYRLISSGSMLISVKEGRKLCTLFEQNGIKAAVIGKITDKGMFVVEEGKVLELTPPGADELYKVL